MRPLRVLKQGVWYAIHTRINNREPLFRHYTALALFAQRYNRKAGRIGHILGDRYGS
ncbi:MAG: hypothetical protein LBG24_01870 [Treponema sp.]|nr:hypothetical protein [Treponema sp.]